LEGDTINAIVLAAGYATRLYPITVNFPKPLLTVARKEIMTRLIEKIEETNIDEISIITNARFYSIFESWKGNQNSRIPIHIINDLTTSNETRLGAVGDLNYAINKGSIDDDLLVIPGDNIFDFSFNTLIEFFIQKQAPVIAVSDMKNKDAIKKRYSSVVLDGKGKVISFEEKPENPKSTLTCPAFFILPRDHLELVSEYLYQGHNPDAPGHFLQWLCSAMPVYGLLLQEKRYDIGNIESYNEANKLFEERG